MIAKIKKMAVKKNFFSKYPLQFWFLMLGSLVFSTGGSLAWPFLSIYLQNKLDIPLRYSTLLISIRAFSGVIASFFFAGSFADRFGRRILILASLFGGILYYIGLDISKVMWQFALLMAFWGMLDIFYPVGINAMVADIIPSENRLEAYSLLRIVYNTGYGIGPIIGGIMAAQSYHTICVVAGIGYAISFVFMLFSIKETLPESAKSKKMKVDVASLLVAFKDKQFILSVFLMGIIYISSAGVFNLLSFYASENFGFPESQMSYVFTVNAAMCVFLQLWVIRKVEHIRPLKLMYTAGFIYFIGTIGNSLVDSVPWYCLCMAVITIGELIMTPTMSQLTADFAPVDARGRYMSILSLAKPFGQGVGPAILGYVYDMIAPRMMWVVGSVFALIAGIAFYIMDRKIGNSDKLKPVNRETV